MEGISRPLISLPKINLGHIHLLTDDVGLIQHSYFCIPDRNYGYSSDDMGRALVVLADIYNQDHKNDVLSLITTYLSFLRHAQTKIGHFHNFMGFDRRFLDKEGSEDTLGRVIFGLGHVVELASNDKMRAIAKNMIEKSSHLLENLKFPRAKAYTICGLYAALKRSEDVSDPLRCILTKQSDELVSLYKDNRQKEWAWFEKEVTYGNASICEALLLAFNLTKNLMYKKVGLTTLKFLTKCQWNGEFFDLIGNEGWYAIGGKKAIYGQQPIDAGYLTRAYVTAYEITGDRQYLDLAKYAFEWFFGRNRLDTPLYDSDTGAVSDGLDPDGVNSNCGAESVICFLLALLSLYRVSPKNNKGWGVLYTDTVP